MRKKDGKAESPAGTEAAAFPSSYALKGLFVGAFFALAAYLIQFNTSSVIWGQQPFWIMMQSFHASNPTLYLFDLSPLIFAIVGALIGKKEQESLSYLTKLHKHLEEQNQQLSSLRFRHAKLFEETDDCLFVTKLSGEVVDMNRAGMRLFKIETLFTSPPASPEELCGLLREKGIKAQSLYVNLTDRDRALEILRKEGIVSNFETKLKRFDGTLFEALITMTLKEDLIFGRVIDLSSIKRAEILLKKANAELEKKNQELLKTFSELQSLRLQDGKRNKELARLNEELQRANRLLAEMAITDGLTNLYNHRYFMALLKKEWERAKRNRQDFCVLMIDIDHFKDFNDKWGHQVGDEVLRFVAKTLKSQTRSYDMIARYGGEEFSVIFPDTALGTCYAVAKRMKEAIEHTPFHVGPKKTKTYLTVSIGVSIFTGKDDDPRSFGQVLKDADVALYLAKNQGRNRVEVYRSDLFTKTLKESDSPEESLNKPE